MRKYIVSTIAVILIACTIAYAQRSQISRAWGYQTISANTTVTSSDAFSLLGYSGASVDLPAHASQTLEVWCCDTESGTYKQMYDYEGIPVIITTTTTTWQELPPAIFVAPWIKLRASSTTISVGLFGKG